MESTCHPQIGFVHVFVAKACKDVHLLRATLSPTKKNQRETSQGMVSPLAYVIANSLMQIPVMFLFALFSLAIPAYAIAGFYLANAGWFALVYAADMYAWEAMAQFFSVAFDNPLLGMMSYVQVWFTAFVFSGWLIRAEDIIWPLRVFAYILPLRFTLRSMIYLEFIDSEYEPCDFSSDAVCYGNPSVLGPQDGADVLDKIGEILGPFSSKNTLVLDILMPLALGVGFKIVHAVLLIVRARKASTVLPPRKQEAKCKSSTSEAKVVIETSGPDPVERSLRVSMSLTCMATASWNSLPCPQLGWMEP